MKPRVGDRVRIRTRGWLEDRGYFVPDRFFPYLGKTATIIKVFSLSVNLDIGPEDLSWGSISFEILSRKQIFNENF